MTDAAIISGSLVDVRNVGTHKSVKLTIHVPEEYAMKVVAAFGWPTGVNPVSVAIARLNENSAASQQQGNAPDQTRKDLRSSQSNGAATRNSIRGAAQTAGYLCTLPAFQTFLREDYPEDWKACRELGGTLSDIAAEVVRLRCNVKSRADLTPDNAEWRSLVGSYRAWELAPGVVG